MNPLSNIPTDIHLSSIEIQDTNVHFPRLEPLQRAIDVISEGWAVEHSADDRQAWLDGILEPVWESMRNEQSNSDGTAGEAQAGDVENGTEISRTLGVTVSSDF